ncbi:hypothetical protein C2G38_2212765 [Gigaspora rosea]|uniref:Uncharacterized protein n=1 Tax=Gigaspora rosea TaxID=44941 RepID=A0A397ULJ9_9GLOM|nr:hypothetical protein C2G38_2212765 [Gigaspora rosea]
MSLDQSKYPKNNPFLLKQNNTIYKYYVINEGFYPPENKVCYTVASSRDRTRYEVPDNYLVQTRWGRAKSRHMVECKIMYEQDGPVYIIRFEKNSQQYALKSKKSSTAVANDYLQKKCPNTHATISGIHVFGLNATDVERERKTFDSEVPKFFNSHDRPTLQEIKFNVQNKDYIIDYKNYDKENRDRILDPFIEPELLRDYEISDTATRINQEMVIKIPIYTLDIENMSFETSNVNIVSLILISSSLLIDTVDADDQEVEEEALKYISKACYRCITDILMFIIPSLIDRGVFNTNNFVINIRISADFHYTLILYPGIENYEILKKVMDPLIIELDNLMTNGLVDSNGIKWRVEFFFSSDWKFMVIILGFNAPNSKNFCPWCRCTKKDIGNKDNLYKIEKSMDALKSNSPPPGHCKTPLLSMISLNRYVPDKLHIMLRIWDHLWELVIQEIKSENRYDDRIRTIINLEMKRISVKFYFWQNYDTQNWSYTPLMGGDKEKVLCDFNFEVIFDNERAILINRLWRNFYSLYRLMKEPNADSTFFKIKAKEWFNLFLTPHQGLLNTSSFKKGLYWPKDVTLYMHVLVHHVPEFMEYYQSFGLDAFSCVAVEKKNHDQVSLFYKKSMKDGDKGIERKSAILKILNYENQTLYYTHKSTFNLISKPQYFHVNKKVKVWFSNR